MLGANWKTTVWGAIFAVSTAIASSPALVDFLPASIKLYIRGLASLIVAASGIGLAINVKDRNVTGGVVQQTADGAIAAPKSQLASSSVVDTVQSKPVA